jgi:hypothetical protein
LTINGNEITDEKSYKNYKIEIDKDNTDFNKNKIRTLISGTLLPHM